MQTIPTTLLQKKRKRTCQLESEPHSGSSLDGSPDQEKENSSGGELEEVTAVEATRLDQSPPVRLKQTINSGAERPQTQIASETSVPTKRIKPTNPAKTPDRIVEQQAPTVPESGASLVVSSRDTQKIEIEEMKKNIARTFFVINMALKRKDAEIGELKKKYEKIEQTLQNEILQLKKDIARVTFLCLCPRKKN